MAGLMTRAICQEWSTFPHCLTLFWLAEKTAQTHLLEHMRKHATRLQIRGGASPFTLA